MSETASGFHSLLENAGLTLEMIEKVVLNLLSNAYKFTLRGGVRATVGSRDDRAALIVADTGAGIGLALVHELVTLQGRHGERGERGRPRRDGGRRRERGRRSQDRGRGVVLTAALVDDASVETTHEGTTVRLRTRIS